MCSGERKDVLGALAHGRDMSVLMLCWCQPHGKPGTGLTSLGEIRCPVVSSKCAPGSAPCGGWLCCWYQVPLISVMSGMYCAGDFSFSLSQAQECQEQRPHILPALPHAGSAAGMAARRCWAGASLGLLEHHSCRAGIWCPPPPRGFGSWHRILVAGCHGVLWWMFGGERGPGLECRDVVLSETLLPVPVREPSVLWSRIQHGTTVCWSL